MQTRVLGLAVGLMFWVGSLGVAAAVNCEQVRRYLATGRSPEDVAESMVVDLSEVKKCAEAGAAAGATPTPAPGQPRP